VITEIVGAVIPEDDPLRPRSQLKIACPADALPGTFRVTWTQGKHPGT